MLPEKLNNHQPSQKWLEKNYMKNSTRSIRFFVALLRRKKMNKKKGFLIEKI